MNKLTELKGPPTANQGAGWVWEVSSNFNITVVFSAEIALVFYIFACNTLQEFTDKMNEFSDLVPSSFLGVVIEKEEEVVDTEASSEPRVLINLNEHPSFSSKENPTYDQ